MAMAAPVYSLEDFVSLLEGGDFYPYYGVLLYTPQNGLDGQLHEYVVGHWSMLNRLTGRNALLFAVENIDRDRPIESFRPDDVYEIARFLGTSVDTLPCLVVFTDPLTRNETLVLELAEFIGRGSVEDADLTDFFRSLEAVIDGCVERGGDDRLDCLRRRIGREWPERSPWRERAAAASRALTVSVALGQTVVQAVAVVGRVVGWA